MKNILLGSAAIAAIALATPASAQSARNPKPALTDQSCGTSSNYKLVPAGAPGQWRETPRQEVGNADYSDDSPLATCGPAARSTPLKCVDQNNVAADGSNCSSYSGSSAMSEYEQSTGKTVIKKFNAGVTSYTTEDQIDLGECQDTRRYTWKAVPPSPSSVCGTQTLPVAVTCIDVDGGGDAPDDKCDPAKKPATTREVTSNEGCGYDWTVGQWSVAPPSCGQVSETRTVTCKAPDGSAATEAQCAAAMTPPADRIGNIPSSEYDTNGMIPWYRYGYISFWRIPSVCNVGDPTAIAAECDDHMIMKGSAQAFYLKPRDSRTIDDARTCPPAPTPTPGDPTGDPVTYTWNTPTYVAAASTCGPNTKTGRVFCMEQTTSVEVSDELCDPSKKPQATVTFEDVSGCAPTPDPGPSPTPTPPPPEIQDPPPPPQLGPPAEIELGSCRYTSSGNGRYACGQTFRQGSNPAPFPHELCSGQILAGTETDYSADYQTINAGPGWRIKATLKPVAGARCVVHYRAYGYSDNTQEGWESVYFSGPPTGVPGGLFISKKP